MPYVRTTSSGTTTPCGTKLVVESAIDFSEHDWIPTASEDDNHL